MHKSQSFCDPIIWISILFPLKSLAETLNCFYYDMVIIEGIAVTYQSMNLQIRGAQLIITQLVQVQKLTFDSCVLLAIFIETFCIFDHFRFGCSPIIRLVQPLRMILHPVSLKRIQNDFMHAPAIEIFSKKICSVTQLKNSVF